MDSRSVRSSRALALATAGACLATALLAPAACARASIAQVDVYDRTDGGTLEVRRRFGRRWIAGEPGHEYAIRVRNCTDVRVLAVISVDGVNVITGQTAAPSQSGYVIEPGDYVTVEGWRKDLARTAAFVFTDPSQSYASSTGRPDEVGVIGVALFRERRSALLGREREAKVGGADARAEAPAATHGAVSEPSQRAPSLGTGHGRNEHSPAEWTHFERQSSTPDQLVSLHYESREALAAMGVLPHVRPLPDDRDPFPGQYGFVPDP